VVFGGRERHGARFSSSSTSLYWHGSCFLVAFGVVSWSSSQRITRLRLQDGEYKMEKNAKKTQRSEDYVASHYYGCPTCPLCNVQRCLFGSNIRQHPLDATVWCLGSLLSVQPGVL